MKYTIGTTPDVLHGHPRFYELLAEIAQLHNDKNTDYASQATPLENFTRRGHLEADMYNLITPGRPAFKIAMIDMMKQLDAALKLVKNNETGKVEGVPQRLKDVATYALIAIILYEEEK